MSAPDTLLWAPRAWLPGPWPHGGWHTDVLLRASPEGQWLDVRPGQACPPQAQRLPGAVLPGLVNAHSHAFQRAFAGLAERSGQPGDSFWGWRDRMYRVAGQLGPDALRTVAAQCYAELLAGGYTQVCEFHYLAHPPQPPGAEPPDADTREAASAAMDQALIDAAAQVGIGLTLLPVLYQRAGFFQPSLRPDQQGFARDAAAVGRAWTRIDAQARQQARPLLTAGWAVHSLRAAAPQSLHALRELAAQASGPVHIHVAEQTAEVDDCLQATGQRPVQWLAAQGLLDARWLLVHATHVNQAEIAAVAASGAGVVLCPGTEANLGDGLTDLPGWLAAGVPLTLGSDSQVLRDWREELRWLEYGQRLGLRQRNLGANPPWNGATSARGDAAPALGDAASAGAQPTHDTGLAPGSTAGHLFQRVQHGGAQAAGHTTWGLQAGARADLLLVDEDDPTLAGLPPGHWLDGLVFSGPTRPWAGVMVAGCWRLGRYAGESAQAERRVQAFGQAMRILWD
ncbi:formimidoylglutamate deiminase [Ideonella livida]|uniref:Formimidoylglutamate deiminase n=1 Tax=Ideonella livida TaxID=2707176 RepID=A0A7C9TJV7_9BURK|nr:formimidoylglutamate deiminase [Ideonella livida]NDY91324.1 formimidoylglutamate deiminase [Ideonella livida]